MDVASFACLRSILFVHRFAGDAPPREAGSPRREGGVSPACVSLSDHKSWPLEMAISRMPWTPDSSTPRGATLARTSRPSPMPTRGVEGATRLRPGREKCRPKPRVNTEWPMRGSMIDGRLARRESSHQHENPQQPGEAPTPIELETSAVRMRTSGSRPGDEPPGEGNKNKKRKSGFQKSRMKTQQHKHGGARAVSRELRRRGRRRAARAGDGREEVGRAAGDPAETRRGGSSAVGRGCGALLD